jgi:hypothetical protein
MKKLIALLLLSPLAFSEDVIDIMCEYEEGSEIRPDGSSSTVHFSAASVIFKIDLSKKTMLINDDSLNYTAWQNGNEIKFTTKVGLFDGAVQNWGKVYGSYEQGSINRETGELKLENYTEKNTGEEDFKLGFSREYKCRSYKFIL